MWWLYIWAPFKTTNAGDIGFRYVTLPNVMHIERTLAITESAMYVRD